MPSSPHVSRAQTALAQLRDFQAFFELHPTYVAGQPTYAAPVGGGPLHTPEARRLRVAFRNATGQAHFAPGALDAWANEHAEALRAQDDRGVPALAVWAAGAYQVGVLVRLLERKPALLSAGDAAGDTPLHAAAGAQDPGAVAWLLSHGADAGARDAAGRTPLDVLLLPDPDGPASVRRWGPRWRAEDRRACLERFATHAPDALMALGTDGSTALHVAAALPRPREACEALVAAGLAWNRPDATGRTPADVLRANAPFQARAVGQAADRAFRETALAAGREPWRGEGLVARVARRFGLR